MVRIPLYLAGCTHPDNSYAAKHAVREYVFCPEVVHKHGLKQIGCYPNTAADKRLIMKPSKELLKIDSFLGTNFVGVYGHEAKDDHSCVKNRTGYVIRFANCPVM